MPMPKKSKPKRPLKTVLENIRLARKFQLVADSEAITKRGKADGHAKCEIRLAVWNIWKGFGGDAFEREFLKIAATSDLILCQEALLSDQCLKLFSMNGFEFVHATSYERIDGFRDGVLTVSRLESDGYQKRILCKFPEPIFKTPKAALVTTHRIIGMQKPIMVINIHARLFRRIEVAMEEIIHVMDQLPEHQGPIIFAGDFNTFSPGYLRVINKVLETHGLKHVPVPNDPRTSLGSLDQVFVKDLEVNSIHVDTTIVGSDHFPILLVAKILEERESEKLPKVAQV